MSARPRLLFLCQTFPYPPDGGVWIRSFHTLRILAAEYDVVALCFERTGSASGRTRESMQAGLNALGNFAEVEVIEIAQAKSRVRYVADHLFSLASGRPYTDFLYSSGRLRARLREIRKERYDIVHIDSLVDLARWLPELPRAPLVGVHHNVESALLFRRAKQSRGFSAWYMSVQAARLASVERAACGKVSLNVTVSEQDASELRRSSPGAQFATVPNGVDTVEFTPAVGSRTGCVFVGGTNWHPNREALDYWVNEILPVLREDDPIFHGGTWVGQCSPHDKLRYARDHGVTLSGYVDDVRPIMNAAAVFIVPLLSGGGTRLKILNAWASGMAVVSTTVGCEGLEARNEENILVADSPRAFAAAIQRVLGDAALRQGLGANARRTAETRYSWEVLGSEMLRLYRGVRGVKD